MEYIFAGLFEQITDTIPELLPANIEPPTKFPNREGLTDSQFLEEGCWERVDNLFQQELLFLNKKKKKKTEIFNVCRFKGRLGKRERGGAFEER